MCRRVFCWLALLLPLAAGCSRVDRLPTTPTGASVQPNGAASELGLHAATKFYPLDLGNKWLYAGESSETIVSAGSTAQKHGNWTRKTALTRMETINGREYVREEDELDDPSSPTGGPYTSIRRLRQDRTGLYEVGISPPQAPPFSEIRLLAYPLHNGAKWVMTEYPHTTATVEFLDVLHTTAGRFPAWRIRIRNGGHLPQEQSFVWYGRAGYLGMRSHLDFVKPDASGHIEIIEDQSESLTGLAISRRE